MMRVPSLAAIHAAELKLAQSRRDTRDSLQRAGVASCAMLARPATLVLIAGVTGLLGFSLARRTRSQSRRLSSPDEGTAGTPSAAGVLAAFIVRYGMQHLPFILQLFTAAIQKSRGTGQPLYADTAPSGPNGSRITGFARDRSSQ